MPKINKEEASERYKEFANQYLVDYDGKAAYERCPFWSSKGASAQSAASRLLKNPEVQGYLRAAREERKKRIQIDQDAVVIEWARIGFADMSNYIAWNSGGAMIRDSEQLSVGERRAVQEISIEELDMGELGVRRKTKLKLHSKLTALDALAKHLGMYNKVPADDSAQNLKGGLSRLLDYERPGGL